MQPKYAIIYPPGHGGNFLAELLTLGEDCYSCHLNLSESTTATRLAACIARYTAGGNWISHEHVVARMSTQLDSNSTKIEILPKHIYHKLYNDSRIIVADAFSTVAGTQWAEIGRYQMYFDSIYSAHNDEDKHHNILKNSNLPMLYVDMTQFLNSTFPVAYYESLCQQLGIIPIIDSAIQLHSVWHLPRVKNMQGYCNVADETLQLEWGARRQRDFQDNYQMQCKEAAEIVAQNLKETYDRVAGPDWPKYNTSVNFFDQLPNWVKQECVDFGINWTQLGMSMVIDTFPPDYTELAIKHGYPINPYYQYTYIIPNLLFIDQNKL